MNWCRKKDRRTLGNSKRVHLALIITFCNLNLKDKKQNCLSSNCTIGNIKVHLCVKGSQCMKVPFTCNIIVMEEFNK